MHAVLPLPSYAAAVFAAGMSAPPHGSGSVVASQAQQGPSSNLEAGQAGPRAGGASVQQRQLQQQGGHAAYVGVWKSTLCDVVRMVGRLLGLDLESAIAGIEEAHSAWLRDLQSQLDGQRKQGQGGPFQADMGPIWYEGFSRAGLSEDMAQLCAYLALGRFPPGKYVSLPALLNTKEKAALLVDSWEELVRGGGGARDCGLTPAGTSCFHTVFC